MRLEILAKSSHHTVFDLCLPVLVFFVFPVISQAFNLVWVRHPYDDAPLVCLQLFYGLTCTMGYHTDRQFNLKLYALGNFLTIEYAQYCSSCVLHYMYIYIF
jgi:hypothetical protein